MVFLMRGDAWMLGLGSSSVLAFLTRKPYSWRSGVKCVWNVGNQYPFAWLALKIGMMLMREQPRAIQNKRGRMEVRVSWSVTVDANWRWTQIKGETKNLADAMRWSGKTISQSN
jgi:hypothetical protein